VFFTVYKSKLNYLKIFIKSYDGEYGGFPFDPIWLSRKRVRSFANGPAETKRTIFAGDGFLCLMETSRGFPRIHELGELKRGFT